MKFGEPKNRFKPSVVITSRPKAVLPLVFHLFCVRCCLFLNVFVYFNTSVCPNF